MVQPAPQVTCIVITYRQAPWVHQTLESIFAQTRPFDEIIIIDDASPDDTADTIRATLDRLGRTNEATFIVNDENQGLCANLNHALSLVKTPYYAYIAGDDYMREDRVEKQLSYFDTLSEDYAMVYSDCLRVSEDGVRLPQTSMEFHAWPAVFEGDLFADLVRENWVPAPSVMLRTRAIKALGGYDESLSFEDYDMWLKISYRYKIGCVPEPLVAQQGTPHSLGKKLFTPTNPAFIKSRGRIFIKYVGDERLQTSHYYQIWNAGYQMYKDGADRQEVLRFMRAGRPGISWPRYLLFFAGPLLRIPARFIPTDRSAAR